MKKVFVLMLSMLSALTVHAYTCVNLRSGDPKVLLQNVTIGFEVDWDHARVTNWEGLLWPQYLQKRGEDFIRDWPKDREKAESYFTVRFNKKSDYMRIDQQNTNAEYRMIVRIASIDVGNGGSTFNPWASAKAGGVIINGSIEIRDRAGNLLCVMNIIEAKGIGHMSETVRYGLALMNIAGDLCDFIKDVKKGKVAPTPVETDTYGGTEETPAQPAAVQQATVAQKTTTQPTQADALEATVTLKNGSTVSGKVKAFNPVKSITLIVAGIETEIPMSEVKNVETREGAVSQRPVATPVQQATVSAQQPLPAIAQSSVGPSQANQNEYLGSRKLMVTDNEVYPPSISLQIGDQQLTLVLVRGGRMNMGFDGDGSLAMKSEPVHEVAVTSFYISDKPLDADVAEKFGSGVDGNRGEPAIVEEYDDVQTIVRAIAQQSGKAYRLPTEAEWEYAASSDQQNQIFGSVANRKKIAYEWTSDYWGEFAMGGVQTDPQGPAKGDERVIRAYNAKHGKYDRSNKVSFGKAELGFIRLVIKASEYQQ